LGTALAVQGKLAEAIAEYQKALRLEPGLAGVHYNLANVLGAQGKLAEAVAEYTTALQIRPDYPKAHSNLGIALAAGGKLAAAITEYRAALRLNPEFAEAHSNLANALLRQGKLAEAELECQSALRINPDSIETRFNLAEVLVAQGRTREASVQYQELLRRRPDWLPALGRSAWLLATDKDASVRNGQEAVRLAERLCAIAGNQQAGALDVLAAAYAETGRFNDAVGAARKAGELATAAGQQELTRRIQERLKLYQSGLPCHE
jgi:protein O-mannosyl-transferase